MPRATLQHESVQHESLPPDAPSLHADDGSQEQGNKRREAWLECPPSETACRPAGCSVCRSGSSRLFWFEDDLDRFPELLQEDAAGLAPWPNWVVLGAGLGAAIGIRQDLDGEIREATRRHPERWGKLSEAIGYFGEVQYQVPVLLGVYAVSLKQQDEKLHELSGSLISAYTLTGLSTVLVKGMANTDRPSDEWNGGQFGFPSFHVASTMSIGAVLDEYHGPAAGLPVYAAAGLIGWSRIDQRDHDLSDVVFGATLGYVIGKSVARRHLTGDGRLRLGPYVHPTDGSTGLSIEMPF